MNTTLETERSGEEMERHSSEDENNVEIEKERRRNEEAFTEVKVDTKNRETWRKNGSERHSSKAPKLKWKRESST